MTEPISNRRLAENEVVFRRMNEQIPESLEALKEAADSEGHGSVVSDIDTPIHFYCECSDENCRQRLVLRPSEYKEFHQNSSQFVIVPGHQVAAIERIIYNDEKIMVVEKFETPPQTATTLNPTSANNS